MSDELETAPPARLDVPVCRQLASRVELRADGDDDDDNGEPNSPGLMFGHFSRFNNWYEINSWFEGNFLERIAPGAFKKTLKERKDGGETPIRVLLEHGFDPQVGDKPLGVPRTLQEDSEGPFAEVPLFDTSYNRDLAPALRAGAYGQSFRFQVLRDEWENEPEPSDHNPAGIPERTIKEVRVIEFGPTVFPANPAAEAGLRSTTDQFYERLRSRAPEQYDDAVARTQAIRTPSKPVEEPPVEPTTDPEARKEEAAPAAPAVPAVPEEPRKHSEATPSSRHERNPIMDETMTVEERTARQVEIRSRLAEIDNEFAGAVLPEETQSEWDSLNREFDEHDSAINAAEARRAQLARLADTTEGERSNSRQAPAVVRRPSNIYDLNEYRRQARSVDDLPGLYRDGAMRAVESARFAGVEDRDKAAERVERLLRTVDDKEGTLARRVLATGSPVYERAFGKMLASQSTDGLTTEERASLSTAGANGGFAVPFDLDPTVILTSDGVIDPLRGISRVEQVVGNTWQGITSAGITVSRKAESGEADDNAPTVGQPEVKLTRVTGFVPFSMEIDQDWTRMRAEITMLLADAKETEEAGSFLNGTGVDPEPEGLLTGLTAAQEVAVAAANALAASDLTNVEEALPPRFRARARWIASRAFYNTVRALGEDSDGGNLWVRIGQGLPPELLGYPTAEATEMPALALGTDNAAAAVFGDFSKFLIVDKVGMNVELVPHLLGANRRPTGERGIFAVWRNSSKVLVPGAFRILAGNDGL